MTKRRIYAKKLIADFDFYHLAKEFYMYIVRHPELEQDDEWVKIKELAEDILVETRCRKDYLQEIDPVVRKSLNFVVASSVDTVLETALNKKVEVVPAILKDIPGDIATKAHKPGIRQ